MQTQEPSKTPVRAIEYKQKRRPTRRSIRTDDIERLHKKIRLYVIGSLIVGFAIGVVAMKARHNAADSIAAVNGHVIVKDDLFNALQLVAGPQTMRKLVEDQIQLQYAEKRGYVPTDDQVNQRFLELSHQPNFDLILRNAGMPAAEYKANLKLLMAQEAVFSQGITVTDAEVQSYYNEQSSPTNPKALFYRPPVTTLQAIALRTETDADQALSQVNSGIPFEIVARTLSLDGSKVNGGKLNPIMMGQSPLTRTPAVEHTVFDLRPGQVSQPVFFGGGWWIFKCNEYSPAVQIPFDQVADQARRNAIAEKGVALNGAAIRQQFAAFESSSNIQAFWPQYANIIGSH